VAKWDLRRREHTPIGAEAEGAHADTRLLTPQEIREQRIRLAWDMVFLVLRDGEALSMPAQQRLGAISKDLQQLRIETRSLP
jgi:hypothetical protein